MLGSVDGTGAAARFNGPIGVAVDGAGSVHVADTNNNTIRKVTPAAVVTTLAGAPAKAGSADGLGAAARFSSPSGVAVDSVGSVYAVDKNNNTIRKVTADGVVTTLAGAAGMAGSGDGTGPTARFYFSGDRTNGLAVDSTGNVYVVDEGNQIIRKVTATGVVTTLAGTAGITGSADGTGPAARFNSLGGVAVDSTGNVYVGDGNNSTIRKVTATGVVTTLAGTAGAFGSADGAGAAARFFGPSAVAVDNAGNVYVTDQLDSTTIRKVTAAGVVTTLAGTAGVFGSADGMGAAARFNDCTGVAVDSAGNIYVADQGNSTIRKVTPTGITTTVAGMAGVTGIGLGATPRFASPRGLAIVGGSIVISDTNAILLHRHGAQ